MPLARRPSPPSLCLAPRASNSRRNALCSRAGPCFARAAQGRLPPYEAEFTRTLAELAPHDRSLLTLTPRILAVPQGHCVSPGPVRAPARDLVKPSRPPQAEGCRRHDQADALPECAVCVAPGLNPCRPPGCRRHGTQSSLVCASLASPSAHCNIDLASRAQGGLRTFCDSTRGPPPNPCQKKVDTFQETQKLSFKSFRRRF